MGSWAKIANYYEFENYRTPVDLKDKHRTNPLKILPEITRNPNEISRKSLILHFARQNPRRPTKPVKNLPISSKYVNFRQKCHKD